MNKINAKLLDKKYFIFDIDGTLIDSMGMWNSIDQKVLLDIFGIEVSQMDIKILRDKALYSEQNIQGDIYMIYYNDLVNTYNLGVSAEEFMQLGSDLLINLSVNELDYKKGAGEFLLALKDLGKMIGVASTTTKAQYNIYEEFNQNMISKAPLKNLVNAAVLCEDVSKKKPDPEAYLLVMQKLGAKPDECLVFEDSFNGVIAAKNAGIEVCSVYDEWAENEQDLIDKIADYKVKSFDELMKILELDKEQSQPQ